MNYVFYSNDPLHNDQGGGVEHFRGIYRALSKSNLDYSLVASRLATHEVDDPAVIYISHGSHFLKYFMALWLWFFRNRKIFSDHDVFHFHRNYAAWPKYIFAPKKGKTIITYHGVTGFVIEDLLGVFGKPMRSVMVYLEKKSLSLADQIIFVSDRDRQSMRKLMLGNNYDKTSVIPAAFDSSLFGASCPPSVDLQNRILMVGRIARIKNIPLAIDAISILRGRGIDVELSIAGDGEELLAVEHYAKEAQGASNISFLGKVEHRDIPDLMRRHGIVLLTSASEASPTVVKEAVISLRPVVTTDVGDVAMWVKAGRNGFICNSTPESVAEGIERAQALIRNQAYEQAVDLNELSEENIMRRLLANYV